MYTREKIASVERYMGPFKRTQVTPTPLQSKAATTPSTASAPAQQSVGKATPLSKQELPQSKVSPMRPPTASALPPSNCEGVDAKPLPKPSSKSWADQVQDEEEEREHAGDATVAGGEEADGFQTTKRHKSHKRKSCGEGDGPHHKQQQPTPQVRPTSPLS